MRETNDFFPLLFLFSLFVAVHHIQVISAREISDHILYGMWPPIEGFPHREILASVISILHLCTAMGHVLEVSILVLVPVVWYIMI